MALDGKVALVTGGGRGIGEASAIELAKAGAAVAVADVDTGAAEEMSSPIRSLDRRSLAIRVDIRVILLPETQLNDRPIEGIARAAIVAVRRMDEVYEKQRHEHVGSRCDVLLSVRYTVRENARSTAFQDREDDDMSIGYAPVSTDDLTPATPIDRAHCVVDRFIKTPPDSEEQDLLNDVAAAISTAVLAEREACAEIADKFGNPEVRNAIATRLD